MPAKVKLTVSKGQKRGESHVFDQIDSLVIGRKDDCSIVLPEKTVSRYHCVINVNPPSVLVYDFGSLNGTFLNGKIIGQREANVSPEQAREQKASEFPLNNGDELGLGSDCSLSLSIIQPIFCADCSTELNPETDEKHPVGVDAYICANCHQIRENEAKAAAARKEEEQRKREEEKAARHLAEQKAANLARKEQTAKAKAEKEAAEKARKLAEAEAAALAAKQQAERLQRDKEEAERKAAAERAAQARARQNQKQCEVCGKAMPRVGGNICQDCINDPRKLLEMLLQDAVKGINLANAAPELKNEAAKIHGYRKIKELGCGGMGYVLLVEDEKTKEQYALKQILPQQANSAINHLLFEREALISGQLNHQNVVRQYEYGSSRGAKFVLMEYCRGGDVDHLIKRKGGKLSIDLATHIMLQILDGFSYTHNAEVEVMMEGGIPVKKIGVVHRDFKPSNIFLSDDSNKPIAKIADFGLAKAYELSGLSGFTQEGSIAGSFEFQPRQQIKNLRFSRPEVDVWAAAASYYYMLTGCFAKDFPYVRNNPVAHRIQCALNNSAIPIRKRNPNIPAKLAEVIDAALIDNPAIPFSSAATLKTMIEDAL
jgi:serine/threonine-protein kinase